VCTRDSIRALLRGPSTSPLGVTVKRRTLVAVSLLGGAGVCITLGVIGSSCAPSERARAAVVTEVVGMSPGTYRAFDGKSKRLFVVRSEDDAIYALVVPLRHGRVPMPDEHWWNPPAYVCLEFNPGPPAGRLHPGAQFQCRDAEMPESAASRWRWSLDGKSARLPGIRMDDTMPVRLIRYGDRIGIYRWDTSR
jgi:hypothetical protein